MESLVSAFQMYGLKGPSAAALSNGKAKKKPRKKVSSVQNVHDDILDSSLEKRLSKKLKNKNKKKSVVGVINNKGTKKKEDKKSAQRTQSDTVQPRRKKKPELSNSVLIPPKDKKSMVSSFAQPFMNGLKEREVDDSSEGSVEFIPVQTDSSEEGLKALEWLIAPYEANEFLNNIWEQKPLHIARKKPSYYKGIISTPIIDDMLRNNNIFYTKNIDITSYDGKRETHNPVGRAHPHAVWDFYLNGCSIRLLNPQTYIPRLRLLNTTLQEFFNSFVGANAYLTPPDSQGFAPHYDDIEALIMQVEGKKQWKVYKPRSSNEVLPRVSSGNFEQDGIGEPILEVTLEAGDMLYFPRGYIHQGVTIDGEHSLHVTVSFYQKHSWADLLEKMVPAALQAAINENVDLRKGLPFDIYDLFGYVNADVRSNRKEKITSLIQSMVEAVKNYLPIDSAVDEMSKAFQHCALPPVLSDAERAVTVYGDSDVMVENGKVTQRVEIELDTRIRLLRKNILRIVDEDEEVEVDGAKERQIRIYFHTENSLEYQEYEPQYLVIGEDLVPAVKTLIETYPEYVSVEGLNVQGSDKIQIANDLWERGLIMTEYPLETIDDD